MLLFFNKSGLIIDLSWHTICGSYDFLIRSPKILVSLIVHYINKNWGGAKNNKTLYSQK